MTEPVPHHNAPLPSRWIYLCRWLFRMLIGIWSLIIFGIVDSIVATRVTSEKDFPPDSLVGRALHNLPLTIAISIILILLTLLFWILSRQRPSDNAEAAALLPLPTPENRLAFVRTLRQEYTRLLTHSLQGAAMLVLGLHERTDVTLSSTQLVFRRTGAAEERPLPPGTSIVEAYDESGQGLLILGEPGAGKTTLLLDLARELLTRAEGNPTHPIPVIVNLSSWAIKQPLLATWLIEQMQLVYRVPSRLSQAWLEHDQWLLLLDGFDEVEAPARAKCIEEINTYRGEHFVPLVICSRTQEYLAQEERLVLPSAVVVQPLKEQQVTEYLKHVGKPIAAVRAALGANPTLQGIITTPLMLNVVILTYRDKAVKDLPQLGSAEQQQEQIFERYIERMLEQRGAKGAFSPHQMRHWLVWLAQEMKQHHLSEFYLESLQPDWLREKPAQTTYALLAGLFDGLLFGLLFGLVGGLVGGLVVGLFVGLFVGLTFGLFTRWQGIDPTEILDWSWKNHLPFMVVGTVFGLVFGLFVGLTGELPIRLPFMLGNRLLSWLVDGLLGGLLGGLILWPYAGFEGSQITEHLRIRPNQGIRSSGLNALYTGLISMLVSGLSLGLVGGLVGGLFFGLFVGLVVGLLGGEINGGGAYLRHYLLRYLLWQSAAAPWHYVRFLEEASERILLQKVGGGYRFIHPLFLDYFASQTTAITSNGSQQAPP